MKTKHLQLAALALLPATLLTLSACSSTTPPEPTSAVYTSDTSTSFVDTYNLTATVKAIDSANRKVTLATARGNTITVKCGPAVANFKQIQVNDLVKVMVSEELSAFLDKGRALGTSGQSAGALAARGAKPGGVITDTAEETVKITAIDPNTRKVTFRFKDGTSHTVKVEKHINLAKAKVGDSVTISHTQAVAVSVEKP